MAGNTVDMHAKDGRKGTIVEGVPVHHFVVQSTDKFKSQKWVQSLYQDFARVITLVDLDWTGTDCDWVCRLVNILDAEHSQPVGLHLHRHDISYQYALALGNYEIIKREFVGLLSHISFNGPF